MADMTQAQARAAAIAAGTPAADVDALIAREGGANVSAQRITSAFGVGGSTGTNDLSTFHAQKAGAPGGGYLSGATPGAPSSMTGLGGATGGGGAIPGTPAAPGAGTVLDTGAGSSSSSVPSMAALDSATGGADSSGLVGGETMGSLRLLGQRTLPQDSMALASLGRRVY